MPDPRIFHVKTVTDTFATVTAVSAVAIAANPRRVDADFVNDSDDVIYLARGNTAVVGSGIRLNPNGGSYHIGTNNLFLGEVYAISDNDQQEDSNMTISEGHNP